MQFDIWKLIDYNLIASLVLMAAAWKWGDWRNWQRYYPTILFFILVDYAYGYITYNQPLWQFESPLFKSTISNLLVTWIGYPSIILLFLPHYPDGIYKRTAYCLTWAALHFLLIEMVSLKLGCFSYHNGWNIWYAMLFELLLFPALRLHHKDPLKAWIITFFMSLISASFFDISTTKMK